MSKKISYQIRDCYDDHIIKRVDTDHPFNAFRAFVLDYADAQFDESSFHDVIMKNYRILTLFYVQEPGENGRRYDMEEMTALLYRKAAENGDEQCKTGFIEFEAARAAYYDPVGPALYSKTSRDLSDD